MKFRVTQDTRDLYDHTGMVPAGTVLHDVQFQGTLSLGDDGMKLEPVAIGVWVDRCVEQWVCVDPADLGEWVDKAEMN